MTEYQLVLCHSSVLQERKARSALKNHTDLTLKISTANIGKSRHSLSLTRTQYNTVATKKHHGLGAQIKVSHKALNHAAVNGSGFFSSVGSSLIRAGGNALADAVGGMGIKRRRIAKHKSGKGFFSSIGSSLIKAGGNALENAVGGMGIKRKRIAKPKRGKGFLSSIGASLIRAGGNALGDVVGGMGIKRRRTAKRGKYGAGIYATGY